MLVKFWDEAFLTATYLINRMPTRVIDNKCPLERLFKTSPNYSLLKNFGCACWPHLRPYTKHKLSFRSKECVFLGYSALHKGYKCLDVDSGRVYISRDVIFDEGVFPFSRSPPHSPSSMPASTPVFHFSAPQLGTNSTNTNYNQMQISLPANPLTVEVSAPTISTLGIATSTDHLELMPLGSPCPLIHLLYRLQICSILWHLIPLHTFVLVLLHLPVCWLLMMGCLLLLQHYSHIPMVHDYKTIFGNLSNVQMGQSHTRWYVPPLPSQHLILRPCITHLGDKQWLMNFKL
jgi:hypothetical protein